MAKIDKIDIDNVAQVNKVDIVDKMLHKCEECGFEAEDKYHVQRHAEAVHLGLKNIKCDQGGTIHMRRLLHFLTPSSKCLDLLTLKAAFDFRHPIWSSPLLIFPASTG